MQWDSFPAFFNIIYKFEKNVYKKSRFFLYFIYLFPFCKKYVIISIYRYRFFEKEAHNYVVVVPYPYGCCFSVFMAYYYRYLGNSAHTYNFGLQLDVGTQVDYAVHIAYYRWACANLLKSLQTWIQVCYIHTCIISGSTSPKKLQVFFYFNSIYKKSSLVI